MTEKEKMMCQLMYDANYDGEGLIAERQKVKELYHEYCRSRCRR